MRAALAAGLVVLMAAVVFLILQTTDASKDGVGAGLPHAEACDGASPTCLPKHTLVDTEGVQWSPAKLAGKVVVVNVWATWCKPCRDEIPAIAEVYTKYREKNVVVLGLLADYTATLDQVKAFAKDTGLNYPIIFMEPEVGDSFGSPTSLPMTYIYDTAGLLTKRHLGTVTKDQLEKEIQHAFGSAKSR